MNREPKGIVKKEEYESLRNEIIEELRQISVKAYRREELYYGDYLELAPDIILQTDDYVSSISAKVGYGKEFLEDFYFGGSHRINGIFIAWGSDIKENLEVNARIYDIAPTILHIFGIPIPKDMDGRVLKEIYKGDLALRKINYCELDERNRIKEKIRELECLGKI
jgi:predicted AlkP superfamily phosphohydrolase/phosphomutase